VTVATAYPGTPSTEILEELAGYKDLYAEWAPNEKVAVEAAAGASMAGVRSLAAMKHVGLNVAADPFFTLSYTGVNGGLVIVVADDPGFHSSQNEQDDRNYANAAKVLMLEPSDSAEAKEMVKLGFELSERFDTPVLLRMTTRVCHSKSIVELGERTAKAPVPYERKIQKYVATPANARVMREKIKVREQAQKAYANSPEAPNSVIPPSEVILREVAGSTAAIGGEKTGVISAGVAYQYAREVFGDTASYLKLGITYPLPIEAIKKFAEGKEKLYIVEELDPYMENQIKAAGIDCIGKQIIPENEELNTDIVRTALTGKAAETIKADIAPVPRPPALCAGCPHRGFFYALTKKKDVVITGDIGCYTLGSAPPLGAMDSCLCMGGSISMGHGAAKAFARTGNPGKKVVAVIGDSTFFHSGVTGLMDVAYNGGNIVAVIMDNRITAMTGQQQNPGTGYTLGGAPAPEVDIPKVCEAVGIKRDNINIINPLDLKACDEALEAAFAKGEPSVIITRWPCALKKFSQEDSTEFGDKMPALEVDAEKCKKCGLCAKTGCPAIYTKKEGVTINKAGCTGCKICKQVCPFEAIN
jgi:indolepyruvate ferredoxin oxidoreductase alpha subunit